MAKKKKTRNRRCDTTYTHRMPQELMDALQVLAEAQEIPRDTLVRVILSGYVKKGKKRAK